MADVVGTVIAVFCSACALFFVLDAEELRAALAREHACEIHCETGPYGMPLRFGDDDARPSCARR